jgi:hypothetical protein
MTTAFIAFTAARESLKGKSCRSEHQALRFCVDTRFGYPRGHHTHHALNSNNHVKIISLADVNA